jgi:biopolymer transport protein ExbB
LEINMRRKEFFRHPAALVCWLAVFCMALGVVQVWNLNGASTVVAQEDGEPGDAEAGDAEAGGEAEAGADAAEAPGGGDKPPENYLAWMFDALGILYTVVFLALSFTLVAFFVMNLLTARRENVCPVALVEEFEEFLNEKQYQEAYEMAKNDDSFLGQVLAAGLAKLSAGYAQALEAMQEIGEEENMKLEHRLSYMALIGTISPMVGLFGTVHGMIDAFRKIAQTTTGSPNPSELAKGISKALFTTLLGLAIAIPAILAYNILKNKVSRLVLEVGILSEGLMNRFEKVGGAKK